jgi:predicted PurR-regulated permease PerM
VIITIYKLALYYVLIKINSHFVTLEQNILKELDDAEDKIKSKIDNILKQLSEESKTVEGIQISMETDPNDDIADIISVIFSSMLHFKLSCCRHPSSDKAIMYVSSFFTSASIDCAELLSIREIIKTSKTSTLLDDIEQSLTKYQIQYRQRNKKPTTKSDHLVRSEYSVLVYLNESLF